MRGACPFGLLVIVTAAMPAAAQMTETDYARAEQFLGRNAGNLISHDEVNPTWLEDDRFWYGDRVPNGTEFILVDPVANVRQAVFDHARLAAALSEAADTAFEPYDLPFTTFEFLEGDGRIRFARPRFRDVDVPDHRIVCVYRARHDPRAATVRTGLTGWQLGGVRPGPRPLGPIRRNGRGTATDRRR